MYYQPYVRACNLALFREQFIKILENADKEHPKIFLQKLHRTNKNVGRSDGIKFALRKPNSSQLMVAGGGLETTHSELGLKVLILSSVHKFHRILSQSLKTGVFG